MDIPDRMDLFSCARVYVEVDLEIGLLEDIKLTVAYWSNVQELDYEHLLFKCSHCHEYGHFVRH